jgi:hypothetical protein
MELGQMFGTTNPFLTMAGYDKVEADQAKTLQDTLYNKALTDKTNVMLPYEMQHTEALTRQGNANALSVENANELTKAIPLEDRRKAAWMKMYAEAKGLDFDAKKKGLDNSMQFLKKIGAAANQFGSIPPQMIQEMNTNYPEFSKLLLKEGKFDMSSIPKIMEMTKDFDTQDLKWHIANLYSGDKRYAVDHPKPTGKPPKPTDIWDDRTIMQMLLDTKPGTNLNDSRRGVLQAAVAQMESELKQNYTPERAEYVSRWADQLEKYAQAALVTGADKESGKADVTATTKGAVPTKAPRALPTSSPQVFSPQPAAPSPSPDGFTDRDLSDLETTAKSWLAGGTQRAGIQQFLATKNDKWHKAWLKTVERLAAERERAARPAKAASSIPAGVELRGSWNKK